MIFEDKFNDKQKLLYELMSQVSEEHWCAGWMAQNEYNIWHSIKTGELYYGLDYINSDLINEIKKLSKELNGWIIWVSGKEIPIEKHGPYFIDMDEWIKIFEG